MLEGQDEKANYSQFFRDLEGLWLCNWVIVKERLLILLLFDAERGYQLKFESPKSENLSLFTHGEREYDNVILFPPKSKGIHLFPPP